MSDENRTVFEALVRAESGRVHNLAFRMLGNRADAEDATQEAFVRIWERLDQRDPARAIGPWAHRVAVRVFLDRIRSRGRRRRAEAAVPTRDATQATEATVERREAEAAVAAALVELPGESRAVLALHFYDGRTQAEAAEILDVPRTTVQSRIGRALEELRSVLRRSGHVAVLPDVEGVMRRSEVVPGSDALTASLCSIASGASIGAIAGGLAVGGTTMSKTVVAACAALVLLAGTAGGFFAGRAWPREDVRGDGTAGSAEVASRGLAASDPRLAAAPSGPAPHSGAQPAAPSSAAPAGGEASGAAKASAPWVVDWTKFAKLIAENGDALVRMHEATEREAAAAPAADGGPPEHSPVAPADQATIMEVFAALSRATASARAVSPRPFFDERVLPSLTSVLFGELLSLSPARREEMEGQVRAELKSALSHFDPETASPVALFSARRALVRRIGAIVEEGVPEAVLAQRRALLPMTSSLFEGSQSVLHVTVADPKAAAGRICEMWMEAYGLDAAEAAAVRPFAERFVRDAKDVLVRHSFDRPDTPPDPVAREAAQNEMLPLLAQAERDVEARLTDAQRRAARSRPPHLVYVQMSGAEVEEVTQDGL